MQIILRMEQVSRGWERRIDETRAKAMELI